MENDHEHHQKNNPPQTTIQEGSGTVTWNPSSEFPSNYEVYVNGTLTEEGSWIGGTISFDTSSLLPGTYNITLVVYDEVGNSASSTVWLEVQGQLPIENPLSIVITAGSLVAVFMVLAAGYRSMKQASKNQEEASWKDFFDDFSD